MFHADGTQATQKRLRKSHHRLPSADVTSYTGAWWLVADAWCVPCRFCCLHMLGMIELHKTGMLQIEYAGICICVCLYVYTMCVHLFWGKKRSKFKKQNKK